MIFHITTSSAWQKALEKGFYEADSLAAEGFIHCSHMEQLNVVLTKYYTGEKDLIKLHIETEKLTSPLIYDWSPSLADTFPHVYGPININAVIKTEEIEHIYFV